jgi:hypothetical protein
MNTKGLGPVGIMLYRIGAVCVKNGYVKCRILHPVAFIVVCVFCILIPVIAIFSESSVQEMFSELFKMITLW